MNAGRIDNKSTQLQCEYRGQHSAEKRRKPAVVWRKRAVRVWAAAGTERRKRNEDARG